MGAIGPPDDLLGVGAAAVAAGVSRSTMRRWLDSGAVPSITTGDGRRLVRRADLARAPRPADTGRRAAAYRAE